MGSLAHDLALGGPFALDGVQLLADRVEQARSRPRRVFRAGRSARARRRARRHSRTHAADREPQRDRKDGAGDRARYRRTRQACRRPSHRRRFRRSCCCPTSGHRSPIFGASSAIWRRPARMATSCRWSIRRKKAFPTPAESNSSSPEGARQRHRRPRRNLAQRLPETARRHRAALRAECEQLGWSFIVHRTDRGPTELLFALHARMGASAHTPTVAARHAPALRESTA